MSNEWAATEADLEGGGGKRSAKPRDTYTAAISRAETKTDKNGLLFIKFGLRIVAPVKFKNRLSFENYLVLSSKANKYQLARRNSFYRAIGLEPGSIPPGAPGGPDVSVLNDTLVDFTLEHEYEGALENGWSLTTSKSAKQPWVADKWEEKLNPNGTLTINGEEIEPREAVTFYNLSDEFAGLGGGTSSDGFTPDDDDAADDSWG